MPKLSVILATFNEEKNIKDCLESVRWANEIVLVDGTSTDKTVAIAKKYTDKILVRENPTMFHLNKQLAIDKATGDWILYLDADERVSPELKKEILATLKKPAFDGYWIPRQNIIFGKWIKHAGWYPDHQLKLFRRTKAHLPCQSVHEQPVLKGKAGYLKKDLIHMNYRTVDLFMRRMVLYTENDKNLFLSQGKKVAPLDAILFPKQEFLKRFFKDEGYKDGLHGLVLSLLQAFSALILFAKVWEEQGFKEETEPSFYNKTVDELKKSFQDFRYWRLKREVFGEREDFFKNLWFKIKLRLPFW